jgi:hypothetical protein
VFLVLRSCNKPLVHGLSLLSLRLPVFVITTTKGRRMGRLPNSADDDDYGLYWQAMPRGPERDEGCSAWVPNTSISTTRQIHNDLTLPALRTDLGLTAPTVRDHGKRTKPISQAKPVGGGEGGVSEKQSDKSLTPMQQKQYTLDKPHKQDLAPQCKVAEIAMR